MGGVNLDHFDQKLTSQGWFLSTEGLDLITQNGILKDLRAITQNALDTDLKEIGKPVLAERLNSKRVDNVVLQIQKVRNISAPKSHEESQAAPRMIKLSVTDGHAHCQAIEIDNIGGLSLHKTAPGTKILLKNATVLNGFIFIKPEMTIVLGGRVPMLYEKWEVNRNMSNYKRGDSDADGPPPWVNFGKKISGSDAKDFKSLEDKTKDSDGKPTEFDVQRNVAIAEATSGAVKKVFGGGTKPLMNEYNKLDGYRDRPRDTRDSREPRDYRDSREPREFRDSREPRDFRDSREPREPRDNRNTKPERRNKRDPKDKNDIIQQKPSDKVSLFAFLEDKLPETPLLPPPTQRPTYNQKPPTYQKAPPYQKPFLPAEKPYNKPPTTSNEYNNYNKQQQSNNYQNRRQNNPPPRLQNKQQPQTIDDLANKIDRLNVNASYAKNAFKQHLNLPPNPPRSNNDFGGPKQYDKPQESNNFYVEDNTGDTTCNWKWNIGDPCLAKYWEDNKYYNATITGLTTRTCVVRFNEYGNMEEVLFADCLPISPEEPRKPQKFSNGNNEYRGNRNFVNRNYRRY